MLSAICADMLTCNQMPFTNTFKKKLAAWFKCKLLGCMRLFPFDVKLPGNVQNMQIRTSFIHSLVHILHGSTPVYDLCIPKFI